MKLLSIALSTIAFIGCASAQRSFIAYPPDGTTVHKGQKITVQIRRPFSIQGSQEVGLALAINDCENNVCPTPQQGLGIIVYHGQYNPVIHEIPGNPYQNFTVQIPDQDWFGGLATLTSTRLHAIGAGPYPTLEFNNITLNIA